MITDKETSLIRSYSSGYMAGILRLSKESCPNKRKGQPRSSWMSGHDRGTEVVLFHKKKLKDKTLTSLNHEVTPPFSRNKLFETT